jgi:hypothetical protein
MNAPANLPAKTYASALMDVDSFNHMQRVGAVLALSPLFPEHLRKGTKETAIANGVLVMNMAMRLQEDPLTVAQNIYFVSGKPGWSSSYMIAKANQHGVFRNPIDWDIKGSKKDGTLSVTAFAVLASTGKKVVATCDMEMAKAEGWTSNKKYQSMPEQMLRYRSATFLIRLYCPEVMVGVPSTIELETSGMKDVTPDDYAFGATQSEPEPEVEEAEEVQEEAPKAAEKPEPEANQKPREKRDYSEQEDLNKPDEEKAPAKPAPTGDDRNVEEHQKTFDRVVGDIMDGASPDSACSFHEEAIDKMKAEAPALYAQLKKELDAA